MKVMLSRLLSAFLWFVVFVLFALSSSWFLFLKTRIDVVQISGPSMEPTFFDGDFVVSWRNFDKRLLKKGDIVIADIGGRPIIKRIEARSGDTLRRALRPFSVYTKDLDFTIPGANIIVPSNNYFEKIRALPRPEAIYFFLIGDNLQTSQDSRMYGLIDENDIRGKVVFAW
jgi:signal peptidase I